MIEKIVGAMGIQAIISVMLVGTCCFLWITGAVVQEELLVLTSAVVMHWLGRKSAESAVEGAIALSAGPPPPPVYVPEKQ